jgi:phosphatidylglycerophosphatase C
VLGLLWRHPARWPRIALLPAPAIAYLLRRLDRGGLKGAVLHCLFQGLSRDVMQDWARRYAETVVPECMFEAAVDALHGHLAAQDHVVVLSASPDIFVPEIARCLGAHEVICTQIRWQGDRLDGRLDGPNRRDQEKLRVIEQLRARLPGLPVIAYGNSGADLPHLLRCEEGVYVNATAAQAADLARRGLRCVQWR